MNRRVAVSMTLATVIMAMAGAYALAAVNEDRGMIRHIVLYKFKDSASKEDVQKVVDTFCSLPSKIKEIADFEHGLNVSTEGKSDGLTHAFVVTFKSEQDRDAYLKHPAHLAYVEVVKNRREKVVVFDYKTDE